MRETPWRGTLVEGQNIFDGGFVKILVYGGHLPPLGEILDINVRNSFFLNWASLHTRLNSHSKTWSHKKRKYIKI